MAEIDRASVSDAQSKGQGGAAVLVCAYEDDEKWKKMKPFDQSSHYR
ncbi:MAG: hypothetical protein ABSD47_21060 [Candidatus Methylomirabilota bacterium]